MRVKNMLRCSAAAWLSVALAVICAATGCNGRVSSDPAPNIELAKAIRDALEEGAGGGPGEAVAAAEPNGWATLRGVFTLTGDPPPKKSVNVNQDHAVCAPGGKTVFENDVVVGPNGELANVLIYLVTKTPDDPKWIDASYDATKTAKLEYDQKNCVFLYRVFAMRSTQSLKLLNSDPVPHNTKLAPKAGAAPFSQTISPSGSLEYTPGGEEPSPFPVACNIHPWMSAWMITRNSPYFKVTDDKGSFEIERLPAGVDLEFRVFHERAKGQSLDSVTLDGTPAKWPKGRYKLKLEDGKDVDIKVVVSSDVFK